MGRLCIVTPTSYKSVKCFSHYSGSRNLRKLVQKRNSEVRMKREEEIEVGKDRRRKVRGKEG